MSVNVVVRLENNSGSYQLVSLNDYHQHTGFFFFFLFFFFLFFPLYFFLLEMENGHIFVRTMHGCIIIIDRYFSGSDFVTLSTLYIDLWE